MIVGSTDLGWALEKLTKIGHGGLVAKTGRLWFVYAGISRNTPAAKSIEAIHQTVISIHEPSRIVNTVTQTHQ
ncbi:MAG: hypothetical protein ACOC33_00755 [bacterium]